MTALNRLATALREVAAALDEVQASSEAVNTVESVLGKFDALLRSPDRYDVMLLATGTKKINLIKEVRSLTQVGLREAKDLVEAAPSRHGGVVVLSDVDLDAAQDAKQLLETQGGGTVELVIRG